MALKLEALLGVGLDRPTHRHGYRRLIPRRASFQNTVNANHDLASMERTSPCFDVPIGGWCAPRIPVIQSAVKIVAGVDTPRSCGDDLTGHTLWDISAIFDDEDSMSGSSLRQVRHRLVTAVPTWCTQAIGEKVADEVLM